METGEALFGINAVQNIILKYLKIFLALTGITGASVRKKNKSSVELIALTTNVRLITQFPC